MKGADVQDLHPPTGDPPGTPPPLSASALAQRFVELEHQRRQVEAELAMLLDEVDRTQAYTDDGHSSAAGWARALGRWSTGDARDHRRVGRLAHTDPSFADAIGSGRIGTAQARRLGRAFANPRCGDQLPEVLPLLLTHAANMPFEDFSRTVDHWERLADVDGTDHTDDEAHRGRRAHISVVGAEIHVRAHGGLGQGAVLDEIFDRYCHAEFLTDWEQNRAEHGEEATAATLARTDAQRRFDALCRIFLDAAGSRYDGAEPEPLINLMIDVHTADLLIHGEHTLPVPADPRLRRCGTTRGVPVPLDDALGALWWGRIRRVVTDTAGVILDMGRTTRCFTGNLRDAVMMSATGCVMAGCGVDISRCQADHQHEWQHEGTTTLANGAPLCGRHNRLKSQRGFRVQRDAQGYWHTYRPDGTEISDRRDDLP